LSVAWHVLRDQVLAMDTVAASTPAAVTGWLARRDRGEFREPLTYIVAVDGALWLAPRRSEHVALAGGREVLAAGEMLFVPAGSGWWVVEVSNQSTGYCPEPGSWPVVGRALDRLGVAHPGDFTGRIVFRCCPACGERNIVREDDFTCALCVGVLPAQWNFTSN
jgi:hypothetical protein